MWRSRLLRGEHDAVLDLFRWCCFALKNTVKRERKKCRRKDSLTHRHEFNGFDEGIARIDVHEIATRTGPICRDTFIWAIIIGYDCDPSIRIVSSDEVYLVQCDIETVAVVDNEKQQLRCLEFAW